MKAQLLKDCVADAPRSGALIGLDVGKKTLGVAVAHIETGLATPIDTIKRTKFTKDMEALAALLREYDVAGFIVGIPVNMDGSEGPRAQSIRDFAMELGAQYPGGAGFIALWDERLSTETVEGYVDNIVQKRKTKVNSKSSGLIDKLAAQIILQGAVDFISQARD